MMALDVGRLFERVAHLHGRQNPGLEAGDEAVVTARPRALESALQLWPWR